MILALTFPTMAKSFHVPYLQQIPFISPMEIKPPKTGSYTEFYK